MIGRPGDSGVRLLTGPLSRIAWLTCLWLAAGTALAEQRFPPPDFTSHTLPQTEFSVPDSLVWEYVDLGVLAVALCLASYLALWRRSRRGLLALSVFSLAWLGFVRHGCICPIGAIQNVTLAICDPHYAIPVSVVGVLVLPLVFTLYFGRTFCAAVCPLGAAQELVAVRPRRVPAWLDHAMGLLPYVYLGAGVMFAATGTAFVVCRYDPFVAFFRLGGSVNMLLFGGAMLAIGVFVGRPYCRYLCPLGAILRVLSTFAKRHVRIPPEDCIRCRLCEDVCPYGAIQEPAPAPDAAQRRRARREFVAAIVALPVLVGLGAWLGSRTAVALAAMDPDVRLAERVRLEQTGRVDGTTDASDAFRNTGRPREELYRQAVAAIGAFRFHGAWLGAWVGLVIGVKLVHLGLRRRRDEYRPDRAGCVSCGRCFWYCPEEQLRLGLIQELPAPVPPPQEPAMTGKP